MEYTIKLPTFAVHQLHSVLSFSPLTRSHDWYFFFIKVTKCSMSKSYNTFISKRNLITITHRNEIRENVPQKRTDFNSQLPTNQEGLFCRYTSHFDCLSNRNFITKIVEETHKNGIFLDNGEILCITYLCLCVDRNQFVRELATGHDLLSVKKLSVVIDEKSGKVVEVSHTGQRGLSFRPQQIWSKHNGKVG